MRIRSLAVIAFSVFCLGTSDVAHADEPDATFAAVKDRETMLRLAAGVELKGTLMAYDAENATLVEGGTGRIVSVPRASIVSVHLVSAMAINAPPVVKPRERHVGLQIATGPGNFIVDFDYGRFYGFVGTSIGYPLIFSRDENASGYKLYLAAIVAAGGQWKLTPTSNWKFDLIATLTPTWWDGFSIGIGISAGFHYTSPTGFTVGFKIPVFGVGPGCSPVLGEEDWSGTATKRCGNIKTGATLVGNYFLQAGMNLPMVSIGYRF